MTLYYFKQYCSITNLWVTVSSPHQFPSLICKKQEVSFRVCSHNCFWYGTGHRIRVKFCVKKLLNSASHWIQWEICVSVETMQNFPIWIWNPRRRYKKKWRHFLMRILRGILPLKPMEAWKSNYLVADWTWIRHIKIRTERHRFQARLPRWHFQCPKAIIWTYP